jgi:hypothetical protein
MFAKAKGFAKLLRFNGNLKEGAQMLLENIKPVVRIHSNCGFMCDYVNIP